jgi:hypothetical protein
MLAQQLKSILPHIARYEQQIALSWLSLPNIEPSKLIRSSGRKPPVVVIDASHMFSEA